jgi:hypothetical protein
MNCRDSARGYQLRRQQKGRRLPSSKRESRIGDREKKPFIKPTQERKIFEAVKSVPVCEPMHNTTRT